MEELFKKIKESEKYKITYFAEMQNGDFKEYKYFTIEKENIFFYIQKEYFGGFEVTAYKKINWNKKHQITFPYKFFEFKELENIINKIIEENQKRELHPLKDAYKQIIYHEMKTLYNYNGKYQTLEKHLQDLAGYRETQILNNIDFVEMKQNDGKYLVLEFYSKTGQAFAINAKNIDRLIIS